MHVSNMNQVVPHLEHIANALGFPGAVIGRDSHAIYFNDVLIQIYPTDTLSILHRSFFGFSERNTNNRVRGFALPGFDGGFSKAFLREGSLPCVLSTLGHELGHLNLRRVDVRVNEEAKAYAHEFGWAQVAMDSDVTNLGLGVMDFLDNVVPDPEVYPDHARAYDFVRKLVDNGAEPFQLAYDFSVGNIWVPDSLS